MKLTLDQLIILRELLREKVKEYEGKKTALKNNKKLSDREYGDETSKLYEIYHSYWEILDKINAEEF